MTRVIDCDQHLFERPGLWGDYIDPADRDLALRLAPDDLGHWWLMHGDRRLNLAFRQLPGETEAVGEQVRRCREGEPAEFSLEELTPVDYSDPEARLGVLDRQGVDETVLFPNYGLTFEGPLGETPRALLANLSAWNRYAAEVAQVGGGRLRPVGHVSLIDPEWLDRELAALSASGIGAAMTAPALVGGKRLSHPDLRRVWAAFVDHGITPVFHVGAFRRPFDDAWFEGDPDEVNPVLSSVFLNAAPALALADLATGGVFAEFPDLRIGVMELSAIWVPMFLLSLDGGFDFHRRFNGEPLNQMELKPSEYVRRQTRIAAFAYEMPDKLMAKSGDLFMMCSDYPHSEGTATPLQDYAQWAPRTPDAATAPGLFGDNVAWLWRE